MFPDLQLEIPEQHFKIIAQVKLCQVQLEHQSWGRVTEGQVVVIPLTTV